MTNAPPPPGSGGAPSTSHPSGLTFSSMPRRSSYASVVSGTAAAQNLYSPTWSGPLSNLVTSTPSSSYPPQYQPDSRLHRYSSAIESDMQTNGGGTSGGGWRRAAPIPSHSRQFANSIDYVEYPHGQQSSNSFFTPSYLKTSKYVAQLAAAHRSKSSSAQKDPSSNHSSAAPSLSASSSNVNLHRMAPSHRGMTYDIIEHQPPSEDDNLVPLPSKWNEADKYGGLDILGEGLEIRYMGAICKHEHEAAAVRADHPMPRQCGIYYFEITVLAKSKDGIISIGFSSPKASLERLPGWEQESWAYHGDDGKIFFGDNQGQGKDYAKPFAVNDTVGCGVNFSTGTAFFTKNGVYLGNAFRELKNVKLYPSIGMRKFPGSHIKANFGQFPFIFDIDGMMGKERHCVQADINTTSVASLHPTLDESSLIQELVAQFLAHDGYVETAQAFAEEVREEAQALHSGQDVPLKDYEVVEDVDAINRQKIRAAILEGDIDKALKFTNAYYPNVLEDNPQIYFRLRCRKFIEMMRRCTEPQGFASKRSKSSNGAAHDTSDDVFTHDMELDEQMKDAEDSSDIMEMEDSDYGMKYQDLLHETIMYGQELQADYPGDEKREYKKTLDDIFSLVAYPDPKSSVHGHLLEPSGRVPVSEELNSAILVSLGRSSSAALEKLYQQTEVLFNEISEEGGAGAFINVRNDFLI
ncbi:hypothetical protein AJ80_05884 [Polytolypa hystricis UAMH7299]|uniref:Protein FYV10 n=1 Tax=Polytolypa hystricis (strain UAMH7299) TaxID=1447883 RepID=A0A2B7XS17_POLH7|nr:hypothetical protein AJ80_05884 [Polytolypa hystricis UAMH7299]